jgi:lipopolysaccharide/colanic/teichoic acid biosynthesis glycosyltransferase
MAALVLTNYLSQFNPSRLVFVYAWLLAIAYLTVYRLISRAIRQALWRRSVGIERVLIAGSGDAARRIVQAMHAAPDSGLRIAGFVDDPDAPNVMSFGTERGMSIAHRLGGIDDIPRLIHRNAIDQVIVAVGSDRHGDMRQASEVCRTAGVTFHFVPDLLQLSFERAALTDYAGVPLLGVRDASIRGGDAALKRVLDITLATSLLIVTFPLVALVSIWMVATGRRLRIARSERIGRNGVPFRRTSLAVTHDSAREREGRGAAAIERLTSMLRAWPSLFDILRGSMGFVGPFPQTPEQLEHYEDWHWTRLRVTPGLTGLWAVHQQHDLTFDEMVRLDLYYAEHWTLWLDVKTLLRSVARLLRDGHGR